MGACGTRLRLAQRARGRPSPRRFSASVRMWRDALHCILALRYCNDSKRKRSSSRTELVGREKQADRAHVWQAPAVSGLVLALGLWAVTHVDRATAGVPTQATAGYGWPLKLFNLPHPVQANFGDPRMIFRGPPTKPDCCRFRLSPTTFDTHSLPDGIDDLVVTVTDIRGHSGSRSLRITIHNRPGWLGSEAM